MKSSMIHLIITNETKTLFLILSPPSINCIYTTFSVCDVHLQWRNKKNDKSLAVPNPSSKWKYLDYKHSICRTKKQRRLSSVLLPVKQ